MALTRSDAAVLRNVTNNFLSALQIAARMGRKRSDNVYRTLERISNREGVLESRIATIGHHQQTVWRIKPSAVKAVAELIELAETKTR